MKKCPYCGKMNLNSADVCKACQCEIVDIVPPVTEKKDELQKKIANTKRKFSIVLVSLILFPISWGAIYLWNFIDLALNEADYYGEWNISIGALVVSTSFLVLGLLYEHLKSDKQKEIDAKFDEDQTSICPRCGSNNVKVYRKGYDYKVGFWGSIFGVKGAGYAGGFDSNKACCRCLDCGKDWETNYDYRLITRQK